jgi:hypothetical protein
MDKKNFDLAVYYIHFEGIYRIRNELELCPKDTDAPTDNIYMVYSKKINKGL